MSFVLDDQQQMLSETFERFFREHGSIERLRRLREDRTLPGCDPELWRRMAELGFCGLMIEERYGGLGLGMREMTLLLQHAGRWLVPEPLLSSALFAPTLIRLAANESQQQRWLPELATGATIAAVAWSEETTRRDPLNQQTTATVDASDGWRLRGEKRFVLDGNVADLLLVSALTPDGLRLFAVPADAPGLTVERMHPIDERNLALVRFDDTPVADPDVLGGDAEAFQQALDVATIGLAAEMLGAADRAFAITLDYLKERIQFGVPIGSFQALQHRAARMFVQIELARSAVMAAAADVDADADANTLARHASALKVKLSDVLNLVACEGIQMHGGVGVTDEYDIGFYLKRARTAEMLFGEPGWHLDRYARLGGY